MSVGITSTAQELSVSAPLTTAGTIAVNQAAEYNAGSQTSSVAIDWNNGATQRVTLTSGRAVIFPFAVKFAHGIAPAWSVSTYANAPCVVSFSNAVDGATYKLRFVQGDTLIIDEVVLDYANSTYQAHFNTIYDPNARNSAFSSSWAGNVSNYITVPHGSSLNSFGTGGISISAWVYIFSTGFGQQQVFQNFNTAEEDNFQTGYYMSVGNQETLNGVASGGVILGKNSFYVGRLASRKSFSHLDSVTLSNNTWYQLGVTYDNTGTVTFYINGAQSSQSVIQAISVDDCTTPLYIGGNFFFNLDPPISPNDPFKGYMRDLAIYATALTSGNMASLYNSGRPPDLVNGTACALFASNLKGWWKLGDGDNTTTWADASGNANTGTTTGTNSIVQVIPNT